MPRTPEKNFVVGLDYGTLSARAVVVDVRNGREAGTSVADYPHQVITGSLPGSRAPLPHETALQDAQDYLDVLGPIVRGAMKKARVRPEQIAGIGVDFTSCTMLPCRADGAPLSALKPWRRNPHAWVKLWKHHAAQPQADRINQLGAERKEPFVQAYGGKYSSEWFFSKLLETVENAPGVYAAADRFIEAGDWLVWQLCGKERRCVSAAGFKAMRVHPDGRGGWTFPSPDFFEALHPKLRNVIEEKIGLDFLPLGGRAGGLTESMAARTGLTAGTPVASANIDAHAAIPACHGTAPGNLVMILGTSTCHLLVSETRSQVEGICGIVENGVVPGAWGYEAGQPAVGDIFAWFIENLAGAPSSGKRNSPAALHAEMEKKASKLRPGESGLLALDWWNGNRSVLANSGLSGMLVGATLATRSHEIYRALIEATAFGTRKILETFSSHGVEIRELFACGGLAQKNRLLMQIYADVLGRPIRVADSEHTSAVGAAMFGAVAGGRFRSIQEAARSMARVRNRPFMPDPAARRIYDSLYAEYSRLHDLFGRDFPQVMSNLRALRHPRH